MKTTTKILIAIAFLLTAISLNAQQECATICHNGTLVKAIGSNAISGHLNHHSEDVLINTDCNYEIIGNECNTLSLPKISINEINKTFILNKKYALYSISGQLLRIGIIDNNLKSTLPKGGAYILKIKGFQAIKMIINE